MLAVDLFLKSQVLWVSSAVQKYDCDRFDENTQISEKHG